MLDFNELIEKSKFNVMPSCKTYNAVMVLTEDNKTRICRIPLHDCIVRIGEQVIIEPADSEERTEILAICLTDNYFVTEHDIELYVRCFGSVDRVLAVYFDEDEDEYI